MVETALSQCQWWGLVAATSVLEQLDPPRRAAVILALIGLCLLGVTMVVLTMLGARWIRGQRLRPSREPRTSSAPARAKRPLPRDTSNSASETLSGLPPGEETSVDP